MEKACGRRQASPTNVANGTAGAREQAATTATRHRQPRHRERGSRLAATKWMRQTGSTTYQQAADTPDTTYVRAFQAGDNRRALSGDRPGVRQARAQASAAARAHNRNVPSFINYPSVHGVHAHVHGAPRLVSGTRSPGNRSKCREKAAMSPTERTAPGALHRTRSLSSVEVSRVNVRRGGVLCWCWRRKVVWREVSVRRDRL